MATRLFAHGIYEQPRSMIVLKRVVVPLLVLHVVLMLCSGYRAIVQVYSVDVSIPPSTLRTGTPVTFKAVGSGRTPMTATVELIQDSLKMRLAEQVARTNTSPNYDPRPVRAAGTIAMTPEMLAPFRAGAATIRVTGTGRKQWLRLPPATVREIPVTIEK
jgi:hypothetical protein